MRFKMISKVSAGTVLGLAVLTLVALRVNTTGFYERTFNASPDKLWRIWNDPDAIEKWRGPRHYTAPIIRNDPRIGRTYLWSMKSPEGEMSWTTGVYKKVLPNVRIVSPMSFGDATGRPIPGSKVPVPGHWPNEILMVTDFTQSGGKTKVTVTEVGIPLIVKLLSKIAWQQQIDKVETIL